MLVQLEIVQGFADRSFLFCTQLIIGGSEAVKNSMILTKLMESILRVRGINLEPFGAGLIIDAEIAQIGMEIGVMKHFASVLISGIAMPFEFRDDICRMSLLRNTDVYILLGITDFRPAVMTADFRSSVCINLGECRSSALDLACDIGNAHQFISLIILLMKAISSEVNLYFLNSSSSVHCLVKS